MIRYAGLVIIIFIVFLPLKAQYDSIYEQFTRFQKFYASGDLINADKSMQNVLLGKYSYPEQFIIAAYNNLGVVHTLLGKYNESLTYYDLAEKLVSDSIHSQYLGDIYLNKARIFNIQNLFSLSAEYLEKGIRIYTENTLPDINALSKFSTSYLNLGISYIGLRDYKQALYYLEKSISLKLKYKLSNKALPYLSLADLYAETKDWDKVEKYYLKSIDEFIKEYDENYFRLADVYFRYGNFLRSMGKTDKAYNYHKMGLDLSLKIFGRKHPDVSLAYKRIGEHFQFQADYSLALEYYQKAIIALVNGFDDEDIHSNPLLNSTLLDIDLLKILQKKSEAFELFAQHKESSGNSRFYLNKSLETIELAVHLVEKIRNEYLSEESRIFLMENEKETYFYASHVAHKLYDLTEEPFYLNKMYTIARQAKSSVLRNAIKDSEIFNSTELPDSVGENFRNNLSNLAAYNHLIHEEKNKAKPDTFKTVFWKDEVFRMRREKERLEEKINTLLPQYSSLLEMTQPISLEKIQKSLKKNETLIEYFLSNQSSEYGRILYIYSVSHESLQFHKTYLDSTFTLNLEIIKQATLPYSNQEEPFKSYNNYTGALYNMYNKLILPVEKYITAEKLIIIPDEEIAYLPFDIFIKKIPESNQVNYEGLDYLIRNYSISYGYTSSLIFSEVKSSIRQPRVYAFSPSNNAFGINPGNVMLQGTAKEIKAIFNWFRGKEYTGIEASENNFKDAISKKGIFHLAMHSSSDTIDSRYSCLLFDVQNDTLEDGKLFHYEISLSRIRSPMVVLSACNTGSGNLYHGEGVMSLSRAFILAGASSVIKTFWDINDEVSSKIIVSFYSYLSRGMEKDEAMRLAKLEYLSNSRPAFTNPYYWAAYQVIGNKEAVTERNKKRIIGMILITILVGGAISLYFKRRRIFIARSR